MTLYDFERDGEIKEDEAIVTFEDGTKKRMSLKSLFPRGENGEQRTQTAKRNFRGRLDGTPKRGKTDTGQAKTRKRTTIRKVR